jgi:DNA primase
MARFRLGFAPDARASLRSALAAGGIPLKLMVEAGLLVTPESGGEPYDRFRGRVIFPIADRRGRIVAFGGRILGPGEPKYLNSPETSLFHKGRMLYGLAQARGPAIDKNELVVGEGYMDVIALSQAGFVQSVAPLGTALTEDQLALLWQLAPEPTLCFDGDAAGQRAAARALDRALPLLQPGRSLRFALLPAGEDPDSLVRQSGATAMREILDRAAPLDRMLWDLELAAQAPDTPERQAGLKLRLSKRIAVIAERSVAEAYRREMDRRFAEAFAPSARSPRYRPERGRRQAPQPPHRIAVGGEAARRGTLGAARLEQEVFLMAVINHPVLLARHLEELAAVALPTPDLDRLRRAIIDVAAVQTELDAAALRDHLGQQGFAEELSALAGRTRTYGPARPDTSLEDVEEFLRQAIGLLRDREAVAEARAAANDLASAPDDQAAQVRRVQQAVQGGESRRREDDGVDPSFGRRNES